jgi:late competence protein required for DNA uptake (superfamily II DNA/RNA helicase)
MITDNPLNDAIDYINKQDAIQNDKYKCELCGCMHEVVAKDLDTNDYYCQDCIVSGEVTRYLERNEYGMCQILTIINQIK